MKNKYILFGIKTAVAGIVAFIILNLVCFFYYNLAVHSESETGSTDYVWEESKFYSRGTEGFSWGKTDENGFNNLAVFEDGDIDVLMMGSSHMEAFNVAQDRNVGYVLNRKFKDADMDLNVYNIGVSGHTLERCLNNAGNAVKEFKPNKYVVIETASVCPDIKLVADALNGELEPIESNNKGIIGKLQKLPFLRRLYGQIKSVLGNDDGDGESVSANVDESLEELISAYTDELFEKMLSGVSQTMKDEGIKLIIVYNCGVEIDEDGKVREQEDMESVEKFKEACDKNDVIFVNMHQAFCDYYKETNRLPRGFSNSRAGKGHLNRYGHEVLADELFDIICRQESER